MAKRGAELPDWAARERGSDLAWIRDNRHILFPAAKNAYFELGRGAIIVHTDIIVGQGHQLGNPMYYLSAKDIEEHAWGPAIKMVSEYDPLWEFVAVLLKKDRESAYRIGIPSEKN